MPLGGAPTDCQPAGAVEEQVEEQTPSQEDSHLSDHLSEHLSDRLSEHVSDHSSYQEGSHGEGEMAPTFMSFHAVFDMPTLCSEVAITACEFGPAAAVDIADNTASGVGDGGENGADADADGSGRSAATRVPPFRVDMQRGGPDAPWLPLVCQPMPNADELCNQGRGAVRCFLPHAVPLAAVSAESSAAVASLLEDGPGHSVLMRWPTKQKQQADATRWLAMHLLPGRSYLEAEMDWLIATHFTRSKVPDCPTIRKEFERRGLLEREAGGGGFRLVVNAEESPALSTDRHPAITPGVALTMAQTMKAAAAANAPFSEPELDAAVGSLKDLVPGYEDDIDWAKLRRLYAERGHLPHKEWEQTEASAAALASIVGTPDSAAFRAMFARVLDDGNWKAATQRPLSSSPPWIVLVTGLNGIRKTTSIYQAWWKPILKQALGAQFSGDVTELPAGSDSFFRQLDYMIATLALEQFKVTYSPTCSLTYFPTYLLTYSLTCSLIYLLPHLRTCLGALRPGRRHRAILRVQGRHLCTLSHRCRDARHLAVQGGPEGRPQCHGGDLRARRRHVQVRRPCVPGCQLPQARRQFCHQRHLLRRALG